MVIDSEIVQLFLENAMASKTTDQNDRLAALEREVVRLQTNQQELLKALLQLLPSDHAQFVLRNLRQD
jgi:hypothetical protein